VVSGRLLEFSLARIRGRFRYDLRVVCPVYPFVIHRPHSQDHHNINFHHQAADAPRTLQGESGAVGSPGGGAGQPPAPRNRGEVVGFSSGPSPQPRPPQHQLPPPGRGRSAHAPGRDRCRRLSHGARGSLRHLLSFRLRSVSSGVRLVSHGEGGIVILSALSALSPRIGPFTGFE